LGKAKKEKKERVAAYVTMRKKTTSTCLFVGKKEGRRGGGKAPGIVRVRGRKGRRNRFFAPEANGGKKVKRPHGAERGKRGNARAPLEANRLNNRTQSMRWLLLAQEEGRGKNPLFFDSTE